MKIRAWATTALFTLLPIQLSVADEARFMVSPDIAGERILFTYDDDLWLTSVSAAEPVRLTSHPGRESSGKFSPDGKWLVENHGADPDILQVNDAASVLAGRDPQLETAVDTALRKIKEQPFQFPPVPAYLKK